ncbi:hypothetical protein J6590_057218, partial [Homalodisca vitripennis]
MDRSFGRSTISTISTNYRVSRSASSGCLTPGWVSLTAQTPISEVDSQFNLLALHRRRQLTDLVTLFKLVNRLFNCPGLLSGIDFSISRGTRSMSIFRIPYHPTYYAYHSSLSSLLRTGSDAAPYVDFFNETVALFRRKVASLVKTYLVVCSPSTHVTL